MSRQLIVVKPPTITFERSIDARDIFHDTRIPSPRIEVNRSFDCHSSHHFNDAQLDEITDLWLKEIATTKPRRPKTPVFTPTKLRKKLPLRGELIGKLTEMAKKLNRRTNSDSLGQILTQSPNPLLKISRQFCVYRKYTTRSTELKPRRSMRVRAGDFLSQVKI